MDKIGIDATVFLGLHSKNEAQRIATKNFFVNNLASEMFITYEQIAICDTVIWSFNHEIQSRYYPFMDHLHTVVPFKRIAYSRLTFTLLPKESQFNFTDLLTYASSVEYQYRLFTWNQRLLQSKTMKCEEMNVLEMNNELLFPTEIELLYQQSLIFRVDLRML